MIGPEMGARLRIMIQLYEFWDGLKPEPKSGAIFMKWWWLTGLDADLENVLSKPTTLEKVGFTTMGDAFDSYFSCEWIGLRGNLQETIDFPHEVCFFFSQFSPAINPCGSWRRSTTFRCHCHPQRAPGLATQWGAAVLRSLGGAMLRWVPWRMLRGIIPDDIQMNEDIKGFRDSPNFHPSLYLILIYSDMISKCGLKHVKTIIKQPLLWEWWPYHLYKYGDLGDGLLLFQWTIVMCPSRLIIPYYSKCQRLCVFELMSGRIELLM